MEKEAQSTTRLQPFNPSIHGGETAQEFAGSLLGCSNANIGHQTGRHLLTRMMQLVGSRRTCGNNSWETMPLIDFSDDINAVSEDPRKMSFDEMEKLLAERYAPTQNVTMSHFNFHRMYQKIDQTYDDFVNEVKGAAKY